MTRWRTPMQHLDEGLLQAWLDESRSGLSQSERAEVEGHLSSCDQCGRKLEELEETSHRLETLLSGPEQEEGEAPPFKAVVARAHHHLANRHRRSVWSGIGWAASVVAALGVGWIANDLRGGRGLGQAAADRPTVETSQEAPAVADAGPSSNPPPRVVEEAEPPADRPVSVIADAVPPSETSTPLPSDAPASAPASEPRVAEAEPEASSDPGPVILRGRVTDESGRPLEAAQVFVEETHLGTLTDPDGTFSLFLPELLADSSTRVFTLSAQLLGYGGASRALSLPVGDPVSADFRLTPQALALDELVVTGATNRPPEISRPARVAVPIAPIPSSVWRFVSLPEAETAAGFPLLWVPELKVVRIEVGSAGGVTLVRVVQELEGGGTFELVEGRGAVRLDEVVASEGRAWASTLRGDVTIVATAALPVEALEALLERLR